jgi:HPt (histidine-containing phosphotransfer) domain-containing protein
LTPIYALTAHALPEEQKALSEAGMEGCILKPLRSRALNDVLSRIRTARVQNVRDLGPANRVSGSQVDVSVFEELRDVLGQDMFKRKLDDFLRELSRIPEQLGDKLDVKAWDDLAKLAHKFAGSTAVFGAVRLGERLRELELSAKSKSRKDTAAYVAEVRMLCQEVAKVFSKYL